MSDCLRKNISVQQPVYCEDSSGNILADTAMYEWMSVRAAGPNVLKDSTLCGVTRIEDLDLPNGLCLENKPIALEPYFTTWLTDVVDDGNPNAFVEPPMTDLNNPALGGNPYQRYQWYPFGLKVCSNGIGVDPIGGDTGVTWQVSYQGNTDSASPSLATKTCIEEQCPGIKFPLLGYDLANTLKHRVLVKNTSGVKLQCHVFMNCTLDLNNLLGIPPANLVEVQVGVSKMNKTTTEITYDDVFQGSTTNFAFTSTGNSYRYAVDFLCEINNDEVIVPCFRFLTPIVTTEANGLVWQTCGLTVQVVGFCDDEFPDSQTIAPPPPPGGV